MNSVILKNYINLNEKEHIELLTIRNQKNIREVSLDSSVISIEDHLKWVQNLKNNKNKEYYVIFNEEALLGAVNVFDIDNEIKWGIFFKENASLMIKSMTPLFFIEYVFKTFNKEFLYLQAKNDNINAINFDKNLGFSIYQECDKIVSMKMNKEAFEKAKQSVFLKRVIKKMKLYSFEMR